MIAKASHIFFNQKLWHFSDINVQNFNKMLTYDTVSIEQLGSGVFKLNYRVIEAGPHLYVDDITFSTAQC